MVVKDRVGRTRYVAFHVAAGAPVGRRAIEALLPEGARLTRFDGEHGIVRTTHRARDEVVARLTAAREAGERGVTIRTLATSGTLRAAAERLPPGAARRGGERGRP